MKQYLSVRHIKYIGLRWTLVRLWTIEDSLEEEVVSWYGGDLRDREIVPWSDSPESGIQSGRDQKASAILNPS